MRDTKEPIVDGPENKEYILGIDLGNIPNADELWSKSMEMVYQATQKQGPIIQLKELLHLVPSTICDKLEPIDDSEDSLGIGLKELLSLKRGMLIYMRLEPGKALQSRTGVLQEVYLLDRTISVKTSCMADGLNVCRIFKLSEFGESWALSMDGLKKSFNAQ